MTDDLRTVGLKADLDEDLREQAPVAPHPLAEHDRLSVTGDVMGAVEIQDADHYGGAWGLRLVADFPVSGLDVVTVEDRLTEGVYALVRVDEAAEGEDD